MPDAGIGVDVIAGFPGENEKDFTNTYQFIQELDISYLHVFPYSERKNKKSVLMPEKIDEKEIVRRSRMLHNLSDKKRRFFYEQNLGKILPVLFESQKIEGKMFGFTGNYIKVEAPFDKEKVNKITDVNLNSINERGFVTGIF